jgi:hypothetical protein
MAEEEPSKSASEEPKPSGSEQPSGKSGDVKVVIISAIFTLIGGLIGVLGKGCYDLRIAADNSKSALKIEERKSAAELQLEEKRVDADLKLESEKSDGNRKLERQKLDADLVKLALQGTEERRRDSLGFMVDTNLIADPDIQKGVKAYLDSNKPLPSLHSNAANSSPENSIDVESPDKHLRATVLANDHVITLHDLVDKDMTGEIAPIRLPNTIEKLYFSPDSRMIVAITWDLATHSGDDLFAYLCSLSSIEQPARVFLPWIPEKVSFSDDSRNVVIQHGDERLVVDENGKQIRP